MAQIDFLRPAQAEPDRQPIADYSLHRAAYKAAEFLVAAELSFAGFTVTMASEGLPYDLLADKDGRLFRVQVKSTSAARNGCTENSSPRYEFEILGHGGRKPERRKVYEQSVDVLALVALDLRRAVYRSGARIVRNIRITPDKFTSEMSSLSLEQAFKG